MSKRLLALDGVNVVCQFRADGRLVESYGRLDPENMDRLAKFAHDYGRMVQGNADQFSMFTGMTGWAPPRAWFVRGDKVSVCGAGGIVCLVQNDEGSFSEILTELQGVANW